MVEQTELPVTSPHRLVVSVLDKRFGQRGSTRRCPVARAIHRAYGIPMSRPDDVSVGSHSATIRVKGNFYNTELPPDVAKFIFDWDNWIGDPDGPQFELTMHEGLGWSPSAYPLASPSATTRKYSFRVNVALI